MSKGSSHVFSEIFLHLNFHCKNDAPMLTPAIEPRAHAMLEEYCRKVKGIHLCAIGGTNDHVHLALQMEPFVDLDAFIGKLKGAASHDLNLEFGAGSVYWQRGYGLVSFARQNLPGIVRYVLNQKKHHEDGTTRDTLEDNGQGPAPEGDEG